jgi:DNA polymerase sigma
MKPSNMNSAIPEPWARLPANENYTPQQQLELEIELFAQWMEPTPAEEAAREAVFSQTIDLVHAIAPGIQTEKFGSQTTGLAMPTSDIDIRLFPSKISPELSTDPDSNSDEATEFLASLDKVYLALKQHPDYTLVVKTNSRFPLLGATHVPTGLALQLVASSDTSASREVIKTYLSDYPTLKPLYTVVKTIFDMRGLSDVWYGGLGSYGILMLVAASLKRQGLEKGGRSQALPSSISQQLVSFLNFCGSLDTYARGVGVEPPRLFKKKSIPTALEAKAAEQSLVSTTAFLPDPKIEY